MVVDKDDNLILADGSFLRMYSKDGEFVKECILGGASWDISYHKKSGRIVALLTLLMCCPFESKMFIPPLPLLSDPPT
jgi:hypothetical protein